MYSNKNQCPIHFDTKSQQQTSANPILLSSSKIFNYNQQLDYKNKIEETNSPNTTYKGEKLLKRRKNARFTCMREGQQLLGVMDQMVQPQDRKKKQSIETRATDSKAVTIPHTNSSTMEMFMSSDHRVADNFNITLRNTDAIGEHTVSNQNASLFFSFLSLCVQNNNRDERFGYLFEDFNHHRNNGCKWLNY